MTRIAIIGGGISGLAAAFEAEQRRRSGVDVQYTVYESSPRLGGVLRTEFIDGCVVEAGPDSFVTEKPWASDLCRAVGIGDQLIGSNDGDRKTYILTRGRLVEMPDGLMFMVPTKIIPTGLSPLFSWKTKIRMAKELLHPPRSVEHDESVADFVDRHYGREMVDRLADPLLSGIYGGQSANLSVRAVLQRFAEMERTHGSLGRAMLAARKKMRATKRKAPPPLFTSVKNGMQSLVDAVVSQLSPASLLTKSRVSAVKPSSDGWSVFSDTGSERFDAVIIALPRPTAAWVLRETSPDLASELGAIQYSSSMTVGLAYDFKVRQSLPPGFGFLVPRSEGKRLLAATFVHNKFPHRAPHDRALLRCFFAGDSDEQVWNLSESQIVDVVREELLQILGPQITGLRHDPLFARVYKWKSAMAQYGVGHLEQLKKIENFRKALSGLALAGNGYGGIGVPDCVRSGREAVKELLRLEPSSFAAVPSSSAPGQDEFPRR